MKRFLSIWLLSIVLLQSTGNCWIVAAFYLNRDHIAETLCINRFDLIPICKGSCFLELKLSENEKRQEKSPDIKYKEVLLFCQAHTPEQEPYAFCENHQSFPDYQSGYFPRLLSRQVFKPPAILV